MSITTDTKAMLHKKLVLKSDPSALKEVEKMVDLINAELNVRAEVYPNLMVAVTEAVNNSVHHGNKGEASKRVYVEFEMTNPYCLRIRVRDEGEGFDPEAVEDPTSPENLTKVGGRGVFVMRRLCDELYFKDEGKQVEMLFNI